MMVTEQQRKLVAWAAAVEQSGEKTSIYYRLHDQVIAARAAIEKEQKGKR